MRKLGLLLFAFMLLAPQAQAEESGWSIGVYGGKYYDSEPAGFTQGRANFLNQHLVALTASKTVWRSESLPLSLEIDRMLNLLLIELAFSRPQHRSSEVFVRLHHRCAVYDLINNYGANGEDFLAFGYRLRF